MNIFENNKSSSKPIKIFLKASNSNKAKDFRGLKKIKMNNLGECLIGSGEGNIIELFSI